MVDYGLDVLAPKAQYSVGNAKRYFEEHLAAGDYYAEGQRVTGQWFGKGAENLGLSGTTAENDFVRLCESFHPQSGERLTLRQKTTRSEIGPDGQQSQSANRRVFFDFTFSPPKSVSIAALIRDDSFRQFVRGYAVTSYASQGKSVNHVLFSDSAVRATTNQQQWYVTISRGQKGVHIFATDKIELCQNITRSRDRTLALDFC